MMLKLHDYNIQNEMRNSCAIAILKVLPKATQSFCYGCQTLDKHGHSKPRSSQHEHDICVMMDRPAQAELCYEKCVQLLNINEVLHEWESSVGSAANNWHIVREDR